MSKKVAGSVKRRPSMGGSANRKVVAKGPGPVRYAVVGAGHIAQNAVLPAFAQAQNSKLVAVFSDDAAKRRRLTNDYGLEFAAGYDQFAKACESGLFEAVYVALPNTMHREYAIAAAKAGVHVLCEKPLATTAADCRAMIAAAARADVRLMTAYRLHFERANMTAVDWATSGKLGELRAFSSVFSMQVKEGNTRLQSKMGGGPLYDIGIYSINAARYLFRANPIEVVALQATGNDKRFKQIGEMVSAAMRFPGERLAAFTCSFGAADAGRYELLGTKGSLTLDPAFEYEGELKLTVKVGKVARETTFPKRDQFAPEIEHFSECVRLGRQPEPGGAEGMIDVAIIEAIQKSARLGRAVKLGGLPNDSYPSLAQERRRAPARKPKMVGVQAPTR